MEKTNRKSIPFNFELWGQEDIKIYDEDNEVLLIHLHPSTKSYYGVYKDGTNFFGCIEDSLTMYQEVKPREIWVNEYTIGLSDTHYPTKELAIKYAANTSTEIRQIKFIEVID